VHLALLRSPVTPTSELPRLAEIMGALSLTADMGAGQAPETAIGVTVVAVRLRRALGMSDSERSCRL